MAIILLIIAIIIGLSVIFKTEQKQKYVEYDGKNINEVRYPGYKELIDNLKKIILIGHLHFFIQN